MDGTASYITGGMLKRLRSSQEWAATKKLINVSDGQRLYRVRKDGGGLERIIDQSIEDLILLDDVFYYRSAHAEGYDKDSLLKERMEGYSTEGPYVYSYKIGDEAPQMFSDRECGTLISDGKEVYAGLCDVVDGGPRKYLTVCISNDGSTALLQGVDSLYDTCIYRDVLYRVVYDHDKGMCSLRQRSADQGTERELTSYDEFYGNFMSMIDCLSRGNRRYPMRL